MPFNNTFYETPQTADMQDFLTIFQWINNTATDGLFFPMMILVIWIVQFISILSEGRRASNAWIYASFTAFVLSTVLGILALMSSQYVYLIVIMLSFGIFFIKMTKVRE
jgi:hypothetical protein